MKPETIMKFKTLLEEQREGLSSSRNLTDRLSVLQENEMLEEVDLAAAELGMETWIRLCRSETLFLKKIDATLQRIAEGKFGQCTSCKLDIEFSQLKLRPTLDLCRECLEMAEALEHQYANKVVKRKSSVSQRLNSDRMSGSWNIKVR
jgi:RNA polymerase-binding protein DksA